MCVSLQTTGVDVCVKAVQVPNTDTSVVSEHLARVEQFQSQGHFNSHLQFDPTFTTN